MELSPGAGGELGAFAPPAPHVPRAPHAPPVVQAVQSPSVPSRAWSHTRPLPTTHYPLPTRLGAASRRLRSLIRQGQRRLPVAQGIAHATLAAAAVALLYPAITAGALQWQDDTRYFYYPLLATVAAALKEGRLPLWEPGLFGGYPLFADGESGMLYPFHLLALRALDPATALLVLRLLRFYLAGAFTYAFLRATGARPTGALVAGLAFMLSGFMVGQVVHENLATGMIWLPLALYFVERAVRAPAPHRYRFAAFAGVALAMQALAVHVQVCILTVLVVFPYLGWRVCFRDTIPARLPGRLLIGTGLGIVAGVVAAGLSAVQMAPLLDIAGRSARGGGIGLAAATINSVSPFQLLTVLFPHLFKRPDSLAFVHWVEWEVTVYVGVPVLFLAVVAIALRRDRFVVFFAAVAVLSLLLATGRYGPAWVTQITQDLLGNHGLRSPGRFAFLWSFAAAVLAGLGVDWLDRALDRRVPSSRPAGRDVSLSWAGRVWYGIVCGVLGGITAGLLLSVRSAYAWVREHPDLTLRWLDRHYVSFDRSVGLRVTPEEILRYVTAALHPGNPATVIWALSLVGGYGLLVAWHVAGSRRSMLTGPLARPVLSCLTVICVALPLLASAARAHPVAAIATIAPASPAAGYVRDQLAPAMAARRPLLRVYTSQPVYLYRFDVEPNALLPLGVQEAGGYSSLNTETHLAYAWAAETTQGRLLDVWNAGYYLWPNRPQLLPSHELTSFHPQRPLVAGSAANRGAAAAFRVPAVLAENVRIIATMRDAHAVAPGTTVAWVTATDETGLEHRWPLRFGSEIGEATAPPPLPPGADPAAAGDQPLPVFSWQEFHPGTGAPYRVHLYYAKLPLDRARAIVRLSIRPVPVAGAEMAILRVYGLGLGQPDWWVHNVFWSDRERFVLAFQDEQVQVYRNLDALPRAYLVPLALRVPGALHIKEMSERAFDPERVVLVDAPLEGPLEGPSAPYGDAGWLTPDGGTGQPLVAIDDALGWISRSPAGRVAIERYDGAAVIAQVEAASDAWLFLADTYDPGWCASLDGQAVPLRRANGLFRAVAVPAGRHEVAFRYDPEPLRQGAALSLATGIVVLMVAGGGAAAVCRRRWQGGQRGRQHAAGGH